MSFFAVPPEYKETIASAPPRAERMLTVGEPGRGAVLEADTIGPFAVTHTAIDALGALDLHGFAVLAFDIDLRNPDVVKAVRAALPENVPGQHRLFLIDKGHRASRVQAVVLGASEVLERPVSRAKLEARLHALLSAHHEADFVRERLCEAPGGASIVSASDALVRLFRSQVSGLDVDMDEVVSSADDIMDAIAEVGFGTWMGNVRRYHEGTYQHCLLVTGVATHFGQSMGMREADVRTLTVTGLLHDIGKAEVPLEILDKPGRLDPGEASIMRQHPLAGYRHLMGRNAVPEPVLLAVRHHHEMLDGSGYPDGLMGARIGDITRILTICDIFGALIERRAYKPPLSGEAALDVLQRMSGEGKLESALVNAFARTRGL